VEDTPAPAVAESESDVDTAPDMEAFFTFTWARRPARGREPRRDAGSPQGQGKPKRKNGGKQDGRRGAKSGGKPGGKPQQGAKTFTARPPKREKPIDPDNPFAAALMGLKDSK